MKFSKQIADTPFARISFVLGVVISLAVTVGLSRPKTVEDHVMEAMGLKSCQLTNIDQIDKSEMALTMNSQLYTIDYTFFSNRSENFRLMVPAETGELEEVEAPPVSTIRGTLRGVEGSNVAGCVTDEGCCAKVTMPSGETYFIEPISRVLEAPVFAGVHVVYSPEDVLPSNIRCGNVTNLAEAAQLRAEQETAAQESDAEVVSSNLLGGAGVVYTVGIAMEADFEYFSDFGSRNATLNQLEMLVNIVNRQYERQASIRHEITDIIIRQTSNEPWTTSFGPDLLDQVEAYYRTGPGNGTITGDMCYLFTGRRTTGIDEDGDIIEIAGRAELGTLCGSGGAFGFVTPRRNGNLSLNVLAHEMGHNWGLLHCDEYETGSRGPCPVSTMNSQNNGANVFHPTISLPRLIASRDSRRCVGTRTFFGLAGPPTTNDSWVNRTPLGVLDFSTDGTTFGFTTESNEQDLTNAGSTAWWSVTSGEDGTMVIDTFGSDFDTQLHVYEFVPGSGFAGLVLVDNDDDTNGRQSQVAFEMTAGAIYHIRVGGFRNPDSILVGSQGNVVLNGSFTGVNDCVPHIALVNGIMMVTGTIAPDDITVSQSLGMLDVNVNDECLEAFPVADIDHIMINGLSGADVINVGAVVVTTEISGGTGADTIIGGALEDEIMGGPGPDTIFGGPADDLLCGGTGNDTVCGSAGNDELFGADGTDLLLGGPGDDEMFGGLAGDTLSGGTGNDLLVGQIGADILNGQGGDDVLRGLSGPDELFGGPGNDTLTGGAAFDLLDGGSGVDTSVDRGEIEVGIEN